MLNHTILMGHLTADPTLRHTQSGIPVARFSIACDRDYKNANGEKRTDFIDIVAWRSTAEFVAKYLSKGRMAVIDGRLQLRDWTDRNGNKRRSAEILANSVNFGDSKPQTQAAPAPAPAPVYSGGGGGFQELDEAADLPF